jgi:hypothetical protein
VSSLGPSYRVARASKRPRWAVLATSAVLLLIAESGTAAGQAVNISPADQPSPPRPIYVTVGLGAGTLDLAAHVGVSVRTSDGEFTARLAALTDLTIFGPSVNANDVALLYSWRRIRGTRWAGIGGGLGVAWVAREECVRRTTGLFSCARYEVVERQWAPGFAFHGAVGWRGVSVSALGDVNAERSFAAVTLNLHIGKVR